MQKVSIKGVLIGGVTDIVATNILFFPLMVYAMITKGLLELPPEEMEVALFAVFQDDILLFSVSTIFGSIASVLGGYTAAAIAKRHQVLNGALSAYLCIGFLFYSLTSGISPLPVWRQVVFLPLSPLLGMLGGYLRLRRIHRHSPSPRDLDKALYVT